MEDDTSLWNERREQLFRHYKAKFPDAPMWLLQGWVNSSLIKEMEEEEQWNSLTKVDRQKETAEG